MPFDWQATPQIGIKGKSRGLASVAETSEGWKWQAYYRKWRGCGWCDTEQEARDAADEWLDLHAETASPH